MYARPPPEYPMPPGTDILLIKKALPGTKQGAHLWYNEIQQELLSRGFFELPSAKCLFVKADKTKRNPIIIFLHVDDGGIFHNCDTVIDQTLRKISKKYSLSDDDFNWYLGLQADEDKKDGSLKLSCPSYIKRMITRFGYQDSNPKSTPSNPSVSFAKHHGAAYNCQYQQAIGALMWPSCVCRPDITYAVNLLARFTSNPSKEHWSGVKRVMCYLKKYPDLGIKLRRTLPSKPDTLSVIEALKIEVFSDSDFAACRDTRRSTTGFIIMLSGNLIAWCSSRQKCTTLSTCEAEFVAGTDAIKLALFFRKVLHELECATKADMKSLRKDASDSSFTIDWKSKSVTRSIFLSMDNASAVQVTKTGDFRQKLKHISVRYHFLSDQAKAGRIKVSHVPGVDNPADLFTKAVKPQVHASLIGRIVA
jgi:hypothetical protein